MSQRHKRSQKILGYVLGLALGFVGIAILEHYGIIKGKLKELVTT